MRPSVRVSETITQLAQIMTPNEANFLGKVFGGSLLALIDLCASATAQKYSGLVSVTASFDRVDFHDPIEIGELVTLTGHVSFVGRTSMEVTIDVSATNLRSGESRHTNTARVTMVALDSQSRPAPVPSLICETREEKIRFLEGKLRKTYRQQRIKELSDVRTRLEGSDDAELDSLMIADGLG
ncbi:MAG: acyl-CoA thioesterase [Chthonomonadaceae bacterium]|nr:acyl-CoA thioesterase [Chthonomonadaceae bacterium]